MDRTKIFFRIVNAAIVRSVGTVILSAVMTACGPTVKLRTTMNHSPYDVPMSGKNATRDFSDSSSFSFPLTKSWEYDASAGFGNGSPIVVGKVMIIGTLQGELHAVDIETGKRIGYVKNFSPISSSAAVYKKYIIYGIETTADNLISIDTDDGEIQWTRNVGGVVSSPLIDNDRLFIGGLDGKIYCLDADYGSKKWVFDTESPIRSSACAWNNIVFCANTKGIVFAFDANSGERKWQFSTGNAVYAGLSVSEGNIVVGSRDSTIYILDALTGTMRNRIPVGDKIMSTPAISNNTVFVPSLNGTLSAFSISDGSIKWIFRSKGGINTTPIITSNAVFITSLDKHLYALSPSDGTVLWKHDFDSRIKTTPLVWRNSVIVAAEDRNIYCFR